MLDYDRMTEVFWLDQDGTFYNNHSRGRAKADEQAGYLDVHGYWRVVIDYKKYYVHHLVWFWVTGKWPKYEIDHINGDRADNTPSNLRLYSHAENCRNSDRATGESGLKGAYLDKRNNQWYSKIQLGDQQKFLGNHSSAEEANQAYLAAAELYHGDFAFHNRNPERPL